MEKNDISFVEDIYTSESETTDSFIVESVLTDEEIQKIIYRIYSSDLHTQKEILTSIMIVTPGDLPVIIRRLGKNAYNRIVENV